MLTSLNGAKSIKFNQTRFIHELMFITCPKIKSDKLVCSFSDAVIMFNVFKTFALIQEQISYSFVNSSLKLSDWHSLMRHETNIHTQVISGLCFHLITFPYQWIKRTSYCVIQIVLNAKKWQGNNKIQGNQDISN